MFPYIGLHIGHLLGRKIAIFIPSYITTLKNEYRGLTLYFANRLR